MPSGLRAGFPTHWRSFGDGPETALLLHCALAHSGAWRGVASALSGRLSLLAPDMPGHGKSADWDHRRDLHDQITDIALDCLGSGGHVIGHSFGATIALRLAIEAPEKVRSLTLIEPVLFAAAKPEPAIYDQYLEDAAVFGAAMQKGDWAASAKAFTTVWGGGGDWDALPDNEKAGLASRMHFIRETEPCLFDDRANLLGAGRCERITCPTLLMRGADTEPVIGAIHRALAKRIDGAKDVVIPNAGHMVPLTHPELVAERIVENLDRARPRHLT